MLYVREYLVKKEGKLLHPFRTSGCLFPVATNLSRDPCLELGKLYQINKFSHPFYLSVVESGCLAGSLLINLENKLSVIKFGHF